MTNQNANWGSLSLSYFIFLNVFTRYNALIAHGGNGILHPEIRLIPAMIGSFLMPIGLFWFAWTAKPNPCRNTILCRISTTFRKKSINTNLCTSSCQQLCIFLRYIYLPLFAASALAALGLLRYLLAMAFPLFTVQSTLMSHRILTKLTNYSV